MTPAAPGRLVPRRLLYAAAAAVLAFGAPVGLMVVRLAEGSGTSVIAAVGEDLRGDTRTYAYVTSSTVVVFALFGYVLGRQADALVRLSRTDPLTGLGNARAFEEHLFHETARTARYREPLSLLAVDVDGLKRINDAHGHGGGDLALQAVGRALRQGARSSDMAARVGGDEFALLAPSTSPAAATALAERVRALVAAERAAGLTISIGVATAEGGDAVPAHLREAADRALYEAKRRGRDRVVAAASPALTGPAA
jgi:diguanylate cyclase (GGDEF)-like protein